MTCPKCRRNDQNDRVIDSREDEAGSLTRRRHLCLNCAHRWTTLELPKARLTVKKLLKSLTSHP